jgi:toxin CcdB
MPKYDVYPSPDGSGYLLDVQTDLLGGLNTRVVVPLLPESAAPKPARMLNPLVDLGGERHVMATQFLSAVPAAILGKPTANLSGCTDDITRAIDMLFRGF